MKRRRFLGTAAAAGLSSILMGADSSPSNVPLAAQEPALPPMPKRKLGKTGVEVPCLALGVLFNARENQEVLKKALELGVTYWDTADRYFSGNSERGIGDFLTRNPDVRKDLFLVTKSCPDEENSIQDLLDRSLQRLKTDYVDLYLLHHADNPRELTDDLRDWAEKTKKAGKIRFFGFSAHNSLPLLAAAKLGWIDAIMTSYNYRLMLYRGVQAGIEACHKAGIGLVAMKTQAIFSDTAGLFEPEPKEDDKLVEHFMERGFTVGQAKVKAVLQDERISSACVGRDNVDELVENAAAARDKTKLAQRDMEALKEYARATCSRYCAGCAHLCGSVFPEARYISEVMRCLMYHNGYRDPDLARECFAEIPIAARSKLLNLDYSLAEARCPQRMAIGKLVAQAVRLLA